MHITSSLIHITNMRESLEYILHCSLLHLPPLLKLWHLHSKCCFLTSCPLSSITYSIRTVTERSCQQHFESFQFWQWWGFNQSFATSLSCRNYNGEQKIILTSKLSKVVANVEGLIIVAGIFIINEGDSSLLGIVDDIGQ